MNYSISIFAGSLLALMVSFNGLVGAAAGNYASSVIIHFIGLIGMIIVLLVTKSKLHGLKKASFYMYSAGIVGILTVLFSNMTFVTLGVSLTVALSLLGQLLTSLLIDQYGMFGLPKIPFNKQKIVGFATIIIGIAFMTFA